MNTIQQRAYLHFDANCDDERRVPNRADILEQLREEFPNRKVHPVYVCNHLYNRWREVRNS